MGFDEKAASKLDEVGDEVLTALAEAAKSTKKTWGDFECKECGKRQRQQVEIQDAKAAIAAAEFLANRGFGRPSAKESEQDDEKIIFTRKVVYSGAPEDA